MKVMTLKNTHAAFWLKNKVPVENKQSGKGGNLRKDYKLCLLFKFRSYRKFEKTQSFLMIIKVYGMHFDYHYPKYLEHA